MPERQLRDEIHILYVAGHETTSNTLGFAAALLARHPEERQRLEAELDEVLAGRTPGVDDVRRLRYTEAFLKETLRLYPIAPMLPRKVNREFRIRDHVLGPDRDVWVCQWVTHRDGRWWGDDAPVFRPARWLDGSTAGLPRGAWFPFGGGPRVCFGQRFALTEAVLALASVVQRFVLEPLDDGPLEVEGTILAPRGGVPVRLHARRVAAAVR
jgi:cytochrome P450